MGHITAPVATTCRDRNPTATGENSNAPINPHVHACAARVRSVRIVAYGGAWRVRGSQRGRFAGGVRAPDGARPGTGDNSHCERLSTSVPRVDLVGRRDARVGIGLRLRDARFPHRPTVNYRKSDRPVICRRTRWCAPSRLRVLPAQRSTPHHMDSRFQTAAFRDAALAPHVGTH